MNNWVNKLYKVNSETVIVRRGTLWNLISSIINSSMTAIIMFFITMTNDMTSNGWFSLATAIAYQCQAIGFFGIRNLHIADTSQEYSFSDYVYFNILSIILMILVLSFLSFKQGYVIEKAVLIFVYGLYRGADIIEALFHDEYQRNGRLDIGVILQTVRFVVSLICLVIVLLITKNLVLGSLAALISSIILIFIQNKPFFKFFPCKLKRLKKLKLKKLFHICLPICIAGFINMYLANAPKYAIESTLNDEMQGIFAILSLPVFTINLLSTVVYKPYISKMAVYWHEKQFSKFKKITVFLTGIIFIFTFCITTFGYFFGLTLLEYIYGITLDAYMEIFILLLIGGGVNSLGAFLNFIMVIFNEQNKNMLIYILSGAFTILFSNLLVNVFELLGAALIYILSSLIIASLCILILINKYKTTFNNFHRKRHY